jgi:hypothetical protein
VRGHRLGNLQFRDRGKGLISVKKRCLAFAAASVLPVFLGGSSAFAGPTTDPIPHVVANLPEASDASWMVGQGAGLVWTEASCTFLGYGTGGSIVVGCWGRGKAWIEVW